MPAVEAPDGTLKYVPGVYTGSTVVSDLAGPLPEFQIPILVASAEEGHPYNADETKQDYEADFTAFKFRATTATVKEYFGADSDMAVAFKAAKNAGLPFAYCVCASALTRASIIAQQGATVDELTIFPLKWGAPGGWPKIKWATGILEITPLKHYSRLTVNAAAGDTRIYLRDNSWVQEGTTIDIGDNTTAIESVTVLAKGSSIDANGQLEYWVDLTAVLVGSFTTALYGMLAQYDVNNAEISPTFAAGEGQQLNDWIVDNSKILGSKVEATFTGTLPTDVASATRLIDIAAWDTPVVGTSPAATVTEHDDLIADLDATQWDVFLLANQLVPQSFYIASGLSTVHASWRDWAIAKRAAGEAVSIVSGASWGDVVVGAGNDTDPTFRALALDSEDFQLCAGGLDRLAAYLSFGPQVWGSRVGGGIGHNLTQDALSYSHVEVVWKERTLQELTTLHRRGVTVYRLSAAQPIRYVISQGLATLQANTLAWNEGTNDTPLVEQRDLVDFVDRVFSDALTQFQLGTDEVEPNSLASVIIRKADQLGSTGRGLISDFQIESLSLNVSGTGWDLVPAYRPRPTTDFLTIDSKILVG